MPPPKPKTYTNRPTTSRSKAFEVFQDNISVPTNAVSSLIFPQAASAPTVSNPAEAAARKALGSKSKNTIVKRPRTTTILSPTSAAVAAAFALRKGKKPTTAAKDDENGGVKTKQTEKEKKPKKVELNEDGKTEPKKFRIKDRYTSLPRPLPSRLRIISNEDEDIVTFYSPNSGHSRRGSWDRVLDAFSRRSYTPLQDSIDDDEIDQLLAHNLRTTAGNGDDDDSRDHIPGYQNSAADEREEGEKGQEEDISGLLSSGEDELAVVTNGCYRVGYVEGRRRIVRLSSGPVTRMVPEGYSAYDLRNKDSCEEGEWEEEGSAMQLGLPMAMSTPMPEVKPSRKGRKAIVKKGSEEMLEPLVSGGRKTKDVAQKRGAEAKRGVGIVETSKREKRWVREPSTEL